MQHITTNKEAIRESEQQTYLTVESWSSYY